MTIEHALEIAAPVQRVWELTVDLESWAAANPNVTRATLLVDAALGVGSRVRIEQRGMGPKVWTVLEYRAPTRFVWSTRLLWFTMTASHDLTATGSGTLNTLAVRFDGPGAGVLGRLARGAVGAALRAENEGIERAATRHAGPGSGSPPGSSHPG